MKKSLFLLFLFPAIMISCKEKNVNEKGSIITKESRAMPDLSKGVMTEEVLWYLGQVSNPQVSPDGKTLLYAVKYVDYKQNRGNMELYTMPVTGGEAVKITNSEYDELQAIWRPDGEKIAFLYKGENGLQIWECNPDGSEKTQISHVEGSINGFSYSPDMKHVIYAMNVQIDQTITERYPDLDQANAAIYDDLMYRHWDSWSDGSYQHLFIAPYPALKEPLDIIKGERYHTPVPPFGGMEEVAWSPDGKKVAYCCKKLTGKDFAQSTNTDIFVYDLETKEEINLTEENKGYDMCPVFSPDGGKIVWWSMKTDGFESEKHRLFIHDFTTRKTIDYSENFDQDAMDFAWGAGSDKVYFVSCKEATYQLYELNINSREIRQITTGDHDYHSLKIAGNRLIAAKTKHQSPSEIFSVNIVDGQEEQLTFVNQEILSKITPAKTEKRWVTTTDGKQMLVWVVLPPNFDPGKKYPALLYCQGGPQNSVSQFFSLRWNFQLMAAHDYIVVAPNRRGVPGFGSEWNDQISQDYGGQNMKDYLSAIDDVSKEAYVDENRLGAVGASFGGFSVYWLAGNHNKRFKAFVAHCGMFNFESWYGATEEYFFANHEIGGPYWKKPTPKSYDFSPHRFLGNWDTPILVIHGAKDFRIPYTEGMQAFNAAQIQGIPSRFMFFFDEAHQVLKPQNSILWQREFFRWLDQWLK